MRFYLTFGPLVGWVGPAMWSDVVSTPLRVFGRCNSIDGCCFGSYGWRLILPVGPEVCDA